MSLSGNEKYQETNDGKIVNIDDFRELAALAILADSDADEFEVEAAENIKRAEELEDQLEYEQERIKKLEKRRELIRKTIPLQTAVMGCIGLVGGSSIAIVKVFENHGPTMTIWGTIGAFLIYLLCGAVLAVALGYVGRLNAVELVNSYTEELRDLREDIGDLKNEVLYYRENAKHLTEEAKKNRKEAWRHRGVMR